MTVTEHEEPVLVGRILGAWGIKGWVQLYAYTDPPEAIFEYQPWIIQGFSHCESGNAASPLLDWKRAGRRLVAQLVGIETPEQAAALADLDIHIPRTSLPPAAPGEYYWHDLHGLQVINAEGHSLGVVRELLATGAHDVLQIAAPDRASDVLIPFVIGHAVQSVDLDERVIRVDWPLEWLEPDA
jgi:16S rRNA processing protein RimM